MSLKEVLLDELRDLYSAENQLVKSLPKSAKAISDSKMKEGVEMHLEQTKAQVQRLREIFEKLDEKPTGKHCNGMEGCINEVNEALEEDSEGALKDAGIMGAALRVEHYEIAGYTAAIAMAKVLGEKEVVSLLTESLHEEEAAAKQILSASTSVLKAADAQEDEEDDEDEEDEEKDPEEQESEEKSEEDEKEAAPEVENAQPKAPAKKTAAKKPESNSGRKYSPAASKSVEREMRAMHEGKLTIGKSKEKVTNPKQAIAIGLAEARRAGKKVPPNPNDPKGK